MPAEQGANVPVHVHPVRVYYEDTDFGGVVYYANYLKFLERGRTEALRALGVDQIALKDAGQVFVVRRVLADYLAPARFDDVLNVRTRVGWLKRASCLMEQDIVRGETRLMTAAVTVACMGMDGRPCRLPPEVHRRLVDFGNAS